MGLELSKKSRTSSKNENVLRLQSGIELIDTGHRCVVKIKRWCVRALRAADVHAWRRTNVREPNAIWRKQQESADFSTAAYLLTFSPLPRGLSVLPDHLWSCAKSNRAGLSALAFHCSSLHITGADSHTDSPLRYSAGGHYRASEIWLPLLLSHTSTDSNSSPLSRARFMKTNQAPYAPTHRGGIGKGNDYIYSEEKQ